MAVASLFWKGDSPTKTPARTVPIKVCMSDLGLQQSHYRSESPPKSPPERMEGYRGPWGVVVKMGADDMVPGWQQGYYLIPFSASLSAQKAKSILEKYPVTGWGD
jgi:hypothetical protein